MSSTEQTLQAGLRGTDAMSLPRLDDGGPSRFAIW